MNNSWKNTHWSMSQIRKEKKTNKVNPSLRFPYSTCDKWKICMINLYPREEFPSFRNSHKNQLDLIFRIVVCKYLTIFFLQKSLFLSLPCILSFLTSDSFVSSTSINLSRMSAHHMHLTSIAFFHFENLFISLSINFLLISLFLINPVTVKIILFLVPFILQIYS